MSVKVDTKEEKYDDMVIWGLLLLCELKQNFDSLTGTGGLTLKIGWGIPHLCQN